MRVLIRQYGCDFTFMKKFLPFKTRKQIQRKYEVLARRDFEAYERAGKKERREQQKEQLRDRAREGEGDYM